MKNILIVLSILAFANLTFAQNPNKNGTGLIFNDEQYKNTPMKAPLVRSLYALPSSASLKKWCPTPKTQGQYGTCVGWSTTYCAMTIIEAQKNSWTDKTKITDNAFSPLFVYTQIKNPSDANCQNGTYINDALTILRDKGAAKYSDFNVNCPSYIPQNLFSLASNYKISDFAKLFEKTDASNIKIESTKKSLSQNKPVVIGMSLPSSFDNVTDCWMPTESPYGTYGGHAMCVIGYDNSKYGGAFEIQNSWGLGWGNQGYFWVRYNDYANFCKYAYELIEPLNINQIVNEESSLSGKVKFVLSNGNEMKASFINNSYRMNDDYKSGTKFRLYISNNEPAFVYAFGSDLTDKTYLIFPYAPNISPALTYKQNNVAIPDEDHYIEMDEKVGTDYLCVLYSLKPLNIDEIRKSIENLTNGTFPQKVQNILSDKIVYLNDVNYLKDNNIGFSAKSKDKTVVALIVETNHIR